jgi:hypothetical protein
MTRFRTPTILVSIGLACVAGLGWGVAGGFGQTSQGNTAQRQAGTSANPDDAAGARLTRGKRLMLKDGSFQLVRSYERNGDRVRYFSLERSSWEEIPAALVDWDATKKAEAESEKASEALVSKVHAQEEASKIETTLDVDASLQVAPNVFLPPGEGMFVIEGRSLTPLAQATSEYKADKKNTIKRVLTPIPIIAKKTNVELPGAKATRRINTPVPEFYLREAPYDPDKDTFRPAGQRPGEGGPKVELVRATVKGNKRVLESIRSLFGEKVSQDRATVSVQRWEVARTVYRFTLSEPLQPGEYALAEMLPDGMNVFVWDFGVDGGASTSVKH